MAGKIAKRKTVDAIRTRQSGCHFSRCKIPHKVAPTSNNAIGIAQVPVIVVARWSTSTTGIAGGGSMSHGRVKFKNKPTTIAIEGPLIRRFHAPVAEPLSKTIPSVQIASSTPKL